MSNLKTLVTKDNKKMKVNKKWYLDSKKNMKRI
jgi:hypothetical protein